MAPRLSQGWTRPEKSPTKTVAGIVSTGAVAVWAARVAQRWALKQRNATLQTSATGRCVARCRSCRLEPMDKLLGGPSQMTAETQAMAGLSDRDTVPGYRQAPDGVRSPRGFE